MKHVTYWKVTMGKRTIGIVARCGSCNRLLDGHWLHGWHDLMLQFMELNYEEGGCEECIATSR